jgi:alcohol dehydrogenase class IV
METNVRALQMRAADSPALVRYDEVAQILTGALSAHASLGVTWVQDLCATLKVPPFTEFGLKEQELAETVAKARKSSSMKGNPVALTDEELMDVLEKANK